MARRGKNDERKVTQILCHRQGKSFEWYYEKFVQDESFTEESQKYGVVKGKFLVKFEEKINLEEEVNEEVVAGLDIEDLGGSLARIDAIHRRAASESCHGTPLLGAVRYVPGPKGLSGTEEGNRKLRYRPIGIFGNR